MTFIESKNPQSMQRPSAKFSICSYRMRKVSSYISYREITAEKSIGNEVTRLRWLVKTACRSTSNFIPNFIFIRRDRSEARRLHQLPELRRFTRRFHLGDALIAFTFFHRHGYVAITARMNGKASSGNAASFFCNRRFIPIG